MASSRSLSSPEAELRHYLQDLLLESSVEETGRELRRTSYYSLNEVVLGGGLSAVAVVANENSLQLQGEQDPEYAVITERLADECNRFSKLRHPNVIQFLGVSFPKGSLLPILVTEQLDVTLSQILHRFNNLPDSLKTCLLLDISLGVQAFHETCSIAHGNLIASSVFLTPGLTAKLSYPAIYTIYDNVMKEDEEEETNPQQTNGSGLHHFTSTSSITTGTGKNMKDDIFALGELMVHVITQRRPKRVGMGHSPSLIQQTEHIDGGHLLRGLIMQCLQKDPILRPTASEIVQEVKMATTTTRKTLFQDPVKVLSAILEMPNNSETNNSSNKSDTAMGSNSPKELRLKRLELENGRLQAQLKVTQSELRHLRVQQTLFGEEEEDEKEKKEVELKDVAVQADIIQVNRQKVYIELNKETTDQSFGFSITGGKGAASTLIEGDQSIFITRLAPGGLAEKDGRLKPRDQLLSVNGIDMTNATRAEALAALVSAGEVCSMVISREEVLTESDPSLTRRSTLSGSRKRSQSKISKLNPLKLGVSLEFEECSPLPEALSNAQAVIYKNKVIVGGHYSSKPGNLFEYDPETDEWNTLTTSPVWFFGLAVFQDKVTAVGGFDSTTQCCSSQLFAWNDREGTWLGSLPSMPTARMHATAVSLGTSLAVAGGRNNKETLKSVEVFNFASQQWYTAHPLTLEQSSMKGLCHNGLWYLLGGEQQGFPTPRSIYTQLQSLIDSALHKTGSVSCFKAIVGLPNVYAGVGLSGGKIVAIGGNRNGKDSETSSTIYGLCEDPISWLEVGDLPVPLSRTCVVSITEEEVLVIGGQDEDSKDTDVVYRMYLQEARTLSK